MSTASGDYTETLTWKIKNNLRRGPMGGCFLVLVNLWRFHFGYDNIIGIVAGIWPACFGFRCTDIIIFVWHRGFRLRKGKEQAQDECNEWHGAKLLIVRKSGSKVLRNYHAKQDKKAQFNPCRLKIKTPFLSLQAVEKSQYKPDLCSLAVMANIIIY